MRVLQVNCVFQKGSTGKITNDLHRYYESIGIESYVIYGRGKKVSEKRVYKVASELGSKMRNLISRYTGNIYGMGRNGFYKTVSLLKRIRPDVVHLQCINGFFIDIYRLLSYLKKENIPTVVTLHAEFLHTGNCGYAFECDGWKSGCLQCPNVWSAIASRNAKAPKSNWMKMKKAFEGFDNLRVVGVSNWISSRAKESPILAGKSINTVFNGLDDGIFFHRSELLEDAHKIHGENKKILLFVTPYFEDDNKGGKWILQLAQRMSDQLVQFVVIGRAKKEYAYKNIHFIGPTSNAVELAKWYSSADLTLLVSKQETFSMICAESLCCGTPIVGFRAGAPELIALKEYSSFVPYGDLDSLVAQIDLWLQKDIDRIAISDKARSIYSKSKMAENYLKEYELLISEKR